MKIGRWIIVWCFNVFICKPVLQSYNGKNKSKTCVIVELEIPQFKGVLVKLYPFPSFGRFSADAPAMFRLKYFPETHSSFAKRKIS